MLAEALNISIETVRLILTEEFGLKKVRAEMVPKNLTSNPV
jgi:hypothetical protein